MWIRSRAVPGLDWGRSTLSQPFIFISTFRLKQGTLEAFKEMWVS